MAYKFNPFTGKIDYYEKAGTVANNSITNAKLATTPASTIKGNNTGSTADVADLTTTQVRTLLNVANGATANDTDANLKARGNHTGTQTASTISDFDTEVSNNTDVTANTTARHTHSNKAILDATTASFTTAQETKLSNTSGANTGDQTTIVGITGTKAQFDTACTDGNFLYSGDIVNAQFATINLVLDGGGSAITTGIKADLVAGFTCTITKATLLADQTGSIVVDIWKDSYANFPPTVADTITASAKPTLSSALKSQDSTLTGWTTSLLKNDILRFNVDSASTITRAILVLDVTRV